MRVCLRLFRWADVHAAAQKKLPGKITVAPVLSATGDALDNTAAMPDTRDFSSPQITGAAIVLSDITECALYFGLFTASELLSRIHFDYPGLTHDELNRAAAQLARDVFMRREHGLSCYLSDMLPDAVGHVRYMLNKYQLFH